MTRAGSEPGPGGQCARPAGLAESPSSGASGPKHPRCARREVPVKFPKKWESVSSGVRIVGRVRLRHRAFDFFTLLKHENVEVSKPQAMHHIMFKFGNILLLQTFLFLRKAGLRMLCLCFVTKLQWMKHFQSTSGHILARGEGILQCIVINKKDDDRRGAFINALYYAQKTIGGIMRETERCLEGKRRKQEVMDELFKFPTKKSAALPVIVSKSGSKEMDKTIASFFYENGISFNVADSSSFARMTRITEKSMRFAKQNHFKVIKPLPANDYLGSSNLMSD